jgi:hypothetical protein
MSISKPYLQKRRPGGHVSEDPKKESDIFLRSLGFVREVMTE